MDDESRPNQASQAATGGPQNGTTRRAFLLKVGLVLNALAVALFAVPILGYVLSPVRRFTWLKWIPLGALTDFPEHQTRLAEYLNPYVKPWDGETAKIPCWVRRLGGDAFQVFAINCTHLGCPVRWFAESELFMCPCHGGVFYSDGRHASGPPPAPLYQYKYKVESGQLWIQAGELPTLGQREV